MLKKIVRLILHTHIIHFNQIHIPVLPYISNFNIIYFMLICLFSIYVSVWGYPKLCNWSYKQVWVAMRVLRIEPWSFGIATSAVNPQVISISPLWPLSSPSFDFSNIPTPITFFPTLMYYFVVLFSLFSFLFHFPSFLNLLNIAACVNMGTEPSAGSWVMFQYLRLAENLFSLPVNCQWLLNWKRNIIQSSSK